MINETPWLLVGEVLEHIPCLLVETFSTFMTSFTDSVPIITNSIYFSPTHPTPLEVILLILVTSV